MDPRIGETASEAQWIGNLGRSRHPVSDCFFFYKSLTTVSEVNFMGSCGEKYIILIKYVVFGRQLGEGFFNGEGVNPWFATTKIEKKDRKQKKNGITCQKELANHLEFRLYFKQGFYKAIDTCYAGTGEWGI